MGERARPLETLFTHLGGGERTQSGQRGFGLSLIAPEVEEERRGDHAGAMDARRAVQVDAASPGEDRSHRLKGFADLRLAPSGQALG